jgi:hypothetical protein
MSITKLPKRGDPSTIQWLSAYDALKDKEKRILDYHLSISERLRNMVAIRDFLIDQVHLKKCEKKRTKFHTKDSVTEAYYRNYLFHGQRGLSSLDVFPCTFQSAMDSLLFDELPGVNMSSNLLMDVYYGPVGEKLVNSFVVREWELDEGFSMTLHDKEVLNRFMTELVAVMDECVSKLVDDKESRKNCIKAREKIVKASKCVQN